jgi:putative radical SAM enzyme (TIGR03279 family)
MTLKIESISPNSLAEKHDLTTNDTIISINNHPIKDFLDLEYYGADPKLKIVVRDIDGKTRNINISQDWETPLGINPVQHQCRLCANKCIFCFVDQMAENMRDSLYVKDDDYLFSFVFGNFITLTNLSQIDFDKIKEQHLSPLYISVHTTNPILRKQMMRHKQEFNILNRLEELSEAGIEFHAQLVLIPNMNDGEELIRSLTELSDSKLNTLSIGIVPIGLTKFRKNLEKLRTYTKEEAIKTIKLVNDFSVKFEKNNIFCSDEFFLKAELPIPKEEYYRDFPQLENGIGIVRIMKDNWVENKADFINDILQLNKQIVFISGISIKFVLEGIIDEINSEVGKNIARIIPIVNDFFGHTVTVSGLLTAEDIFNQVELADNEIPVICDIIFNEDNLTLDNVNQKEFMKHFSSEIIFVNQAFDEWKIHHN